jgi:hypothetical protein
MPAPRLALRVQGPDGYWQEQASAGGPRSVISPDLAEALLSSWMQESPSVLGHLGTAVAGEERPPHAWFLGVAPASAPHYAVAVLLEHPSDADRAADAGSELLESVLHQ